MNKSQVDSPVLVLAVVAAALLLTILSGPFAWLASIGALILLIVLLAYDQEGYRSIPQSIAFSGAGGFCFAVACGAVFEYWSAGGEVHLSNNQWAATWLPFTCGFATLLLCVVDRMRMSARLLGAERISQAVPTQRTLVPDLARQPISAAPAPVGYVQPQPVSAPVFTPTPAPEPPRPEIQPSNCGFSVPSFSAPPAAPVPAAAPTPVFAPPASVSAPAPAFAPPSYPPSASPELVRPAPTPIIPRPAGKEVTIYVTLMGEGMNLLRSVRAEQVGRDYYQINDVVPEGETWSFQPGQVVRCKKQTLSTGKALVAYEEAPRAQ